MIEMLKEDFRKLRIAIKSYTPLFIVALIAIPLGCVIGLVEVLFGKGLALVTAWRMSASVIFTSFLAVAGLLIAFIYKKFGGECSKGMGLVFDAAEEKGEIPIKLPPIVMVASWLTHLFGGSAGREGVAVQIGAAISDQVGKRFNMKSDFGTFRDTFVICGIAAGFAGLFQTPFAAMFFSLEVLVCGELKYKSIFPAVCAAFSSYFVAHAFGLTKFDMPIASVNFDLNLLWKLFVLGLIFGVAGTFFSVSLRHTKILLNKKIPNPYIRIFFVGIFLSLALILLYRGRYSGFGTNLTINALTGGEIYKWDWILKLLLTVLTLASGFQGGELTPLFSIGSSLGVVLAGIFGLPPEFVAALGFSALFGSATNTFLAPVLIGAECFGTENLSALVIVCSVAFFANFGKTIYGSQKKLKLENSII